MYEKQDKGCNGPTGHSLETPDVDDFSFSDIIRIPSASLQWRRVVVGWGCRQDSPSSAWRWSADPGNTHIFIMLYLLHQKILCTHAHTDTYTYTHTPLFTLILMPSTHSPLSLGKLIWTAFSPAYSQLLSLSKKPYSHLSNVFSYLFNPCMHIVSELLT